MNISIIERQAFMDRLPIAECLLVAVAIFWGTSYGLTKETLLYISVLGFIGIRFSLTFFLLIPFFVADYRKGNAKDWKLAVPTGFILLGIFIAETFGVAFTSASNAAFLISLCVVITPFIEWLVYRHLMNRALFIFATMSVVGVFMLTLNPSLDIHLNQGDGYILIAAFLRACMVVVTKKRLKTRA
ncbi:DMT family transporter [Marinomonas sp. 2405UD68-3]|uniref:DMT family transporter n=1 Tax=Marinomonas sp. 2405UD68-3 TaxID=3391835 RepID=UPI0039C8D6A8